MFNLQIGIDKKLKEEADEFFSQYGLSTQSAVRLFLRLCVDEKRIPFTLKQKKE